MNERDNILWIDCETTGLEVYTAKIVSISFIFNGKEKTLFFDPECEVPYEASRIHGLTNKELDGCPTFREHAADMFKLFNAADTYAGYNARNFDMSIIAFELLRCGYELPKKPIMDIYEISQSLFKSLKLKDIYRTIVNEELKDAHNSMADIKATKKLYETIKEKYLCIH